MIANVAVERFYIIVSPGTENVVLRIGKFAERLIYVGKWKAAVKGLLSYARYFLNIRMDTLIYYGLEYRYVTQYLTGDIDYGTMKERLAIAIHQFAKRQMTWFRGMERRGIVIHWTETDSI